MADPGLARPHPLAVRLELYTWLIALAVIVVIPALALSFVRKRMWPVVGLGGAVLPIIYCAVAFWWLRLLPCPVPSQTPYDTDSEDRARYLQTFREVYMTGLMGVQGTYCFSPEAETAGWCAGSYRGLVDYNRFWARSMPDRQRCLLEVSAGRDGVSVDAGPSRANKSVERTGAPPVGSEAP